MSSTSWARLSSAFEPRGLSWSRGSRERRACKHEPPRVAGRIVASDTRKYAYVAVASVKARMPVQGSFYPLVCASRVLFYVQQNEHVTLFNELNEWTQEINEKSVFEPIIWWREGMTKRDENVYTLLLVVSGQDGVLIVLGASGTLIILDNYLWISAFLGCHSSCNW